MRGLRPGAGDAAGGAESKRIIGETTRSASARLPLRHWHDTGWTRARLNEFIKGKRGVTAEAALDLAEALGTSPRLWMNLQATFDLDEASRKRRAA